MSSVTIAGIKFALNGDRADANGFWCNDTSGWYDYSARVEFEARVDQPGSFASDASYAPEALPTFAGVANLASGYEAAVARARLRSVASEGSDVLVVYDDNGFITQRWCRVEKISIPHNHGRPGFKWALDMRASDPYMYGPESVTTTGLAVSGGGIDYPVVYPVTFGQQAATGRLKLNNPGFAPSFPRFEVRGGFDALGFTLVRVATGERITFARSVPSSSTIFIDSQSGRVSLDGQDNDLSGYLTQYDWWETPAQTTEEVQFLANGTTSGTPLLTARIRPAY